MPQPANQCVRLLPPPGGALPIGPLGGRGQRRPDPLFETGPDPPQPNSPRLPDHRERETLAITDRSYVVRAGKVLCHGTAQEVLTNPDAKKYYFGESPGVEAA